jgi:hypothetical protein
MNQLHTHAVHERSFGEHFRGISTSGYFQDSMLDQQSTAEDFRLSAFYRSAAPELARELKKTREESHRMSDVNERWRVSYRDLDREAAKEISRLSALVCTTENKNAELRAVAHIVTDEKLDDYRELASKLAELCKENDRLRARWIAYRQDLADSLKSWIDHEIDEWLRSQRLP